jgi:hypothetical protein
VKFRVGKVWLMLAIATAFAVATPPAVAQQAAAETSPQPVKASGEVLTASRVPVPGATVRLIHIESGRGWVTWTDERGRFELPNLPPGKYRLEAQQLGFLIATEEFEFSTAKEPTAVLTLKIAPLSALEPKPVSTPAQAAPTAQAAQPRQQGAAGHPPQAGAQPGARRPTPGAAGSQSQRPGQPGQISPQVAEQMRQRMGTGGFQEVDLMGQAGGAASDPQDAFGPGGLETNPLGEASSSDAFLMSGTVGRGATAGPGAGLQIFNMMGGLDLSMFGITGGFPGAGFPGAGFPGGAGGFSGGGMDGSGIMIMMGGPGGARLRPAGREPADAPAKLEPADSRPLADSKDKHSAADSHKRADRKVREDRKCRAARSVAA